MSLDDEPTRAMREDAARAPVSPQPSARAAGPASERKPRPGDELELSIEAFDERGNGLARARDHLFVVRRAVPGERVRVKALRRRRTRVEAVVLERLDRGPDVVDARCAHAGSCGGCTLQALAYPAQLAGKRRLVREALAAHGLSRLAVDPVIGAADPWRYRNKMEFGFASRRYVEAHEPPGAEASFALGLHAAGLHQKVVDVRACPIQRDAGDAILASARAIAREHGLAPWDVATHTGLLRHLVVRTARGGEQVLVSLVTSADAPLEVERFARALLARHPGLTTLVHGVNSRPAQTAIAERERVLHGPGRLVERLGDLEFAVSAGSFFQTNTAQAERLFEVVREEARLAGGETVFDLYCGAGTIALALARAAAEVVGFEQVSSSVADARANAERNGIANARFVEGDVLAELARDRLPRPDLVVVDPPRAGLHPRVPARIAELAPARVVYVSCNPGALARDLAAFEALGWGAQRVRPVDLFPHTPHVECVAALERAEPAA